MSESFSLTPPPQAEPPHEAHTSRPSPRRGGFLKLFCLAVLAALLGAGGYLGYDAHTFLTTPASTKAQDVTIDILPGATFDRVAWDAYKAGALKNVLRFRILAKIKGKLGSIQAGEFTINTGWTPEQLLTHLTSGKANLYRLALREGLPWWEVARLVEEGGFATAAEFEAVIHDPKFLRQYGIPFANAEGFLYPETYLLQKPKQLGGRAQAETVARLLVEMFWKRTWEGFSAYAKANGAKGTPVFLTDFSLKNGVPIRALPPVQPQVQPPVQTQTPSSDTAAETAEARDTNAATAGTTGVNGAANAPGADNTTGATNTATANQTAPVTLQVPVSAEDLRYLVILASLVEKETGVGSERGRVAGVYANRMRIGMLLQCDPTIIYGLGKKQNGPIRRSQLDDAKNLYNTYKHPGLPPGPICSPGAASIRSAVAPEDHKYLYFVATGKTDGTHTFSTNLRDHENAVRVYRATQRR